jgi:hypothetical protein
MREQRPVELTLYLDDSPRSQQALRLLEYLQACYGAEALQLAVRRCAPVGLRAAPALVKTAPAPEITLLGVFGGPRPLIEILRREGLIPRWLFDFTSWSRLQEEAAP